MFQMWWNYYTHVLTPLGWDPHLSTAVLVGGQFKKLI